MKLRNVPDWFSEHQWAGDAAWTLAFAALVYEGCARLTDVAALPGATALLLTLALLGPMLLRRPRPELLAVALAGVQAVQVALTNEPNYVNFLMPVSLFALAAYSRSRHRRWWLTAALVASAVAGYDWSAVRDPEGNLDLSSAAVRSWLVITLLTAAFVVASWVTGELARQRRRSLEALRERAEALERERDQRSQLAAQEERSRIAREMHDVVAHNLSVIVVQADGGAYAARHGTDPVQRGATAAAALDTIGATAREALEETRRLVGVLRAGEDADYAPQGTLAQIGDLVARMRAAGLPASYDVVGSPQEHEPLSPGAEMAAYRVVQESLTNVMKHAGPTVPVHVKVEHTPQGVTVAVRDEGPGSRGGRDGDGYGHGLIGMQERVTTFNGTLLARDRMAGGFEVIAQLPGGRHSDPRGG